MWKWWRCPNCEATFEYAEKGSYTGHFTAIWLLMSLALALLNLLIGGITFGLLLLGFFANEYVGGPGPGLWELMGRKKIRCPSCRKKIMEENSRLTPDEFSGWSGGFRLVKYTNARRYGSLVVGVVWLIVFYFFIRYIILMTFWMPFLLSTVNPLYYSVPGIFYLALLIGGILPLLILFHIGGWIGKYPILRERLVPPGTPVTISSKEPEPDPTLAVIQLNRIYWKICSSCGKRNLEDTLVCKACGQKI